MLAWLKGALSLILAIPDLWKYLKAGVAWLGQWYATWQESRRRRQLGAALDKAKKTKDQRDVEKHFDPNRKFPTSPRNRNRGK
jgi:hypothetical protein